MDIRDIRRRCRLRNKIINRKRCFEYLKDKRCVNCGYNNPIALDFDHIKNKKLDVSRLLHGGYSWNTIIKEIEKCQILCSNCHRIKTSEDQNWYNYNNINLSKSQKSKMKSRIKYNEYMKDKKCSHCSENNIIVLEFDHLSNKKFTISRMFGTYNWDAILKEINKCQILCVNCHRIKTSKDQDWYKYINDDIPIIIPILENLMKRKPIKHSSIYKGVSFHNDNNIWSATITIDGRQLWLGSFKKEKDAAKAYNNAVKEHFGIDAYLNKL